MRVAIFIFCISHCFAVQAQPSGCELEYQSVTWNLRSQGGEVQIAGHCFNNVRFERSLTVNSLEDLKRWLDLFRDYRVEIILHRENENFSMKFYTKIR